MRGSRKDADEGEVQVEMLGAISPARIVVWLLPLPSNLLAAE